MLRDVFYCCPLTLAKYQSHKEILIEQKKLWDFSTFDSPTSVASRGLHYSHVGRPPVVLAPHPARLLGHLPGGSGNTWGFGPTTLVYCRVQWNQFTTAIPIYFCISALTKTNGEVQPLSVAPHGRNISRQQDLVPGTIWYICCVP